MSTRAIIGVKNNDGSITGLWQWNDSSGLKFLLQKNFDTINKVMELINLGMISCLYNKKDADELDKWKEKYDIQEEGEWKSFGNVKAYQETRYKDKMPKVYKDFEDAFGQDIDYLYLFDAETNIWSVYS